MGPGSITYLPVRTEGGRLFIGDAHACQGDGEVCGTAVEFASTTTIQVDLIKGWQMEWPRLENEAVIMAIGSARPLEDATRIAYKELILWMEAEYGHDRWDAYMRLSQCGQVRLGNFVDPKYTVGAGISKKYLEPDRDGQPAILQDGAGPEPHRPHRNAARAGQRGGLLVQPGSELHHRHQLGGRRCADQGRAVVGSGALKLASEWHVAERHREDLHDA